MQLLQKFLGKPKDVEDVVYRKVHVVHPSAEDLAQGILPDEYFSRAILSARRSELLYQLDIHNWSEAEGSHPLILLLSSKGNIKGLKEVENIVFGPLDASFSYTPVSFLVNDSVTMTREYGRRMGQRDVADLIYRVSPDFQDIYVSAFYQNVPQSVLDQSETLKRMLQEGDRWPCLTFRPYGSLTWAV